MAAPASRALRRCICTAKQTAYARPTIGATQQRIQRRWQSDAAAPTNPKIATIVDQISQLTLLETADLVSTLKVGKFRILGEWSVYGYLCSKMLRDTAHQTKHQGGANANFHCTKNLSVLFSLAPMPLHMWQYVQVLRWLFSLPQNAPPNPLTNTPLRPA